MTYAELSAAIDAVARSHPGAWLKLRNKAPRLAILVRYPGQRRGRVVWEAIE